MEENSVLRALRKCCRLICHQKEDRCFRIRGYLFPVCARCTGILISFLTALLFLTLKIHISLTAALILTSVMAADWAVQFLKIKESTNTRRFITGLAGGFGLSYLYYYIIEYLISLF
ncbi:MAG: DUF2085 domain-containing protein [Bacillota bacterium]|nr:DUF2085 domain-containing protein [Bacillota bacterium]